MRLIKFLLLLSSIGYATDLSPWFPPPLEIQSHANVLYEKVDRIQSPLGDFLAPSQNASFHTSLSASPLPFWCLEGEIYLTHAQDIAFAFEAAYFTLRYAWTDDIIGDPFTLVTGITAAFPNKRFLRQFSFDYHGTLNTEVHVTVGKEWSCQEEWLLRAWALAGLGVANRGNPWFHWITSLECRSSACTSLGIYADATHGFGSQNLSAHRPFKGYAAVGHQAIDLGGYARYCMKYFGTWTLAGWYNVWSVNFPIHYWGATLSLCLPFSIL